MDKHNGVSTDISLYIKDISEKLRKRQASLMVGSGFSKNSSSNFPNWKSLGDAFYKKLGYDERFPQEKEYLSILKLAQEIEAAFGRYELDKMLKEIIPDTEFEPSIHHVRLVQLPWNDIFTTNYDTLLERACLGLNDWTYNIVVQKEDLVGTPKPRIIKLHGSFPSNRPFIITEEDYRTYPKYFAPFVNTVQQSMIENTFCLIGFSGDDPNFINWLGWIKDNLGVNNTQNIYLIGVFNMSESKKKLLSNRNIIVVDLGKHYNSSNHDYCLTLFLKSLTDIFSGQFFREWPFEKNWIIPFQVVNTQNFEKLHNIVNSWERDRKEYPGWIIPPYYIREKLSNRLEVISMLEIIPEKLTSLPEMLDLNLLYELNWRIEKSLLPYLVFRTFNLEKMVHEVLDKYINKAIELLKKQNMVSEDGEFFKRFIRLNLSLLRAYRENGNDKQWNEINTHLKKFEKVFSPDQKANYHYEKALYYLFNSDDVNFTKEIQSWEIPNSSFFWEIKRAGLYLEIGMQEKAKNILLKNLEKIRTSQSKIHMNSKAYDFYTDTSEATTFFLLDSIKVKNAISSLEDEDKIDIKTLFFKKCFDFKKEKNLSLNKEIRDVLKIRINEETLDSVIEEIYYNVDWEKFYSERNGITKEEYAKLKKTNEKNKEQKNFERLKHSSYNDFSPSFEIVLFKNLVHGEHKATPYKSVKPGFHLGNTSTSYHISAIDVNIVPIFNLLRYYEEIGLIFRKLPPKIMDNLSFIANYSLKWSSSLLLRAGSSNDIKTVFTRRFFLQKNTEEIDRLVSFYLNILSKLVQSSENEEILRFIEPSTIVEILTRLSSKTNKQMEIFIFGLSHLLHEKNGALNNARSMVNQSINCMKTKYKVAALLKTVNQFIESENIKQLDQSSIDPVALIHSSFDSNAKKIVRKHKIIFSESLFKQLFAKAHSDEENENNWAASTLISLHLLRIMPDEMDEELEKLIWNDQSGIEYVKKNKFYSFAILDLPHPNHISPQDEFKRYILKRVFFNQKKENKTSYLNIIPFIELRGSSSFDIKWTNEEISTLFQKCIAWWNNDMAILNNPRDDFIGWDTVMNNFESFIDVLAYTIIPNFKIDTHESEIQVLKTVFEEFESTQLFYMRCLASALFLEISDEKTFVSKFQNAMLSLNEKAIRDALNALLLLMKNDPEKHKSLIHILLENLISHIKHRITVGLDFSMLVVIEIMHKYEEFFTKELIDACLIALDFIPSDTSYKEDEMINDFDLNNKLLLRKNAANLAFCFHEYFNDKGIKTPVEVKRWEKTINTWKEICASEDEFMEIRVQWDSDD